MDNGLRPCHSTNKLEGMTAYQQGIVMHIDLMSIYTTAQIREIEQIGYTSNKLTEYELMQRAGAAAYHALKKHWPKAQNITVFCGSGNNGGDGYVLARLAAQDNKNVQVIHIGDQHHLKNPALQAKQDCAAAHVAIIPYADTTELVADVIVDAIFGIGLNSTINGLYVNAIKMINVSKIPVLSIDIPSGIHADSGAIQGIAVHATLTITLLGLKLGLFTGSGIAYAGLIECADLELSTTKVNPIAQCLNKRIISQFLPHRLKDAHKGQFGHVLIIGGDYGFPGAAHMAAAAVLRVGAGLVSVATRHEHIAIISATRPEIMCHGIHEAHELTPLIERATVIVIGPGLGRSSWSEQLFNTAVAADKPMLIDADGLFWLGDYHLANQNWVLTPHPGEAAKLLDTTTNAIQSDRLAAATLLQQQFGGVAVLKGAATIVCDNNYLPAFCPYGNPGMASGGMGDVLSGVIGGLLAQGLSAENAAKLGVVIHALAGDHAAKQDGERGLLAMDLMPYLRKWVNPE